MRVDELGDGQQALTNLGRLRRIGRFEQDAVVLIGVQCLLPSPFAAEAQPGKRHAWVAFFGQHQLDDTAHGVVVEQGDDVGDLGR